MWGGESERDMWREGFAPAAAQARMDSRFRGNDGACAEMGFCFCGCDGEKAEVSIWFGRCDEMVSLRWIPAFAGMTIHLRELNPALVGMTGLLRE